MVAATESVSTALSAVGLGSFVGAFYAEGIETVADLRLLSESNMKDLGLNMGQRNRLKKHIGHSNQSSPTTYSTIGVAEDVPTIEEREKYYALFKAIDKDGNGDIDYEEFVDALKKMDLYRSETESRRIFNEADEDGGGSLDTEEFINLMHKAKNGKDGTNLAKMAKAGQEVLSKLSDSSGLSFTVEDVLNAPVTDKALQEVQKIFNLLVLDIELVKQLISVVCVSMLEDLESKINEIGIPGVRGFVSHHVNAGAVEKDALRVFVILCHRHAHNTHLRRGNISDWQLKELHSIRKAALVTATNTSVQEVRDGAVAYLKQVVESQSQYQYQSYSTRSRTQNFARDVAVGAGREVAGEILFAAAEAGGCNAM